MKHYFIINPMAGKGKHAEELFANIERVCGERGVDYTVYRTTAVGNATEYVKEVCADAGNLPARFYACGGDGTVCEVVNGAAETKGASIGIIPIGTGNDFVRNFGKKEDFFNVEAQLDGKEVSIDLLKFNDSYAINMINIGFDCEVVKKTVKLKKSPLIPSKLAYIAGVVTTLLRKPGVEAEFSCDGATPERKKYLLTTFANGCFCGGGFYSNPSASLTDGYVDSLFIKNVSRIKFITLVGSYKAGTHLVPKNANILKNEKFKSIHMKFQSTQSVSVDGELLDFGEITISCVPAALGFVVPAGLPVPERVTAEAATV